MKTSLNPLDYHPAEIAKALVALLSSFIAVLGLLAGALSTGGLASAGVWVAGIAMALNAPLVFVKKAAAVVEVFDGPSNPTSAAGE